MKFSHSFRVSPEDIDEQGHVNNVVYLRWILDVAVAHWRHASTEEMQNKYAWVAVRHEIDYRKQAFESDDITAITWVGGWTKVRCERFTEIRRENELIVEGLTLWCMIDRKTAGPARIPAELVERFS